MLCQNKEKIKKMSCEELEKYVLDGKDDWKFAKVQYDLRCIGDVGNDSENQKLDRNRIGGGGCVWRCQ